MPVCTSACKCSGGGCTLPGEQDEFSNAMAIGETEAHTVAVLVDEEEFPACVTPAFNGEDQVSSNIIYFIDILQVYKRYVLLLILTSSCYCDVANFITARLRTGCCLHGS